MFDHKKTNNGSIEKLTDTNDTASISDENLMSANFFLLFSRY